MNLIVQRWNEITLCLSVIILVGVTSHICWDVTWKNRQMYPKELQLLALITLLATVTVSILIAGHLVP